MSPSTSSILRYISGNILANSQNMDEPREKKRRLNHLTWEEKVQRKKLKNRVAAQTSRDRKKARMEQLEAAVQELYAQNERLEVDCARLRDENAQLLLRDTPTTCHCNNKPLTLKVEPSTTVSSLSPPQSEQITCESGPAESRRLDPLQQGLLFLQLVVILTTTMMATLSLPTSRSPSCSSSDLVVPSRTAKYNSWISSPRACSETWLNNLTQKQPLYSRNNQMSWWGNRDPPPLVA